MNTVTLDTILSWRPCYGKARVREIFAGRTSGTAAEWVAATRAAGLPEADVLWLLLHEAFIPAKALHGLACDYAERALQHKRDAGREPDPRTWAAVETKRRWLRGEASDAELEAAAADAWAAVWAAAADEAVAWAAETAWQIERALAVMAGGSAAARHAKDVVRQSCRSTEKSAKPPRRQEVERDRR